MSSVGAETAEPVQDDEDIEIRPEIVIGLVGALGTDLDSVETCLTNALLSVAYTTQSVRISDLIESEYANLGLPALPQSPTELDRLMDMGDELRLDADHGAATARIAIKDISAKRNAYFNSALPDVDETEFPPEREAVASIVRQLKHPDEVQELRSVYGPRFVLIGAWSHKRERESAVRDRLKSRHPNEDEVWLDQHVSRLIRRDEKDGKRRLGQRVRDTFELADAYVALKPGEPIDKEIVRIVRLIFGAPFETPTWEEQAMFQAAGARLRSSAAGRQVGAVVVDAEGELLVTGTNDVPKAGGGQYWPHDVPDHRDFQHGYDFNDREKLEIITDIMRRLQGSPKDPGWMREDLEAADPAELARQAISEDGRLSSSRVGDLLEFGRILHAEMAAICTAARRGTAIGGQTMFTTTYPCHECARLIIGSGIRRLVYVDPYPKSKVPKMYQHEVTSQASENAKAVLFEPFVGIAPRMYADLFLMARRTRDEVTGEYIDWKPAESTPRLVTDQNVRFPIQYLEDSILLRSEEEDEDGPGEA